jgi:tRNA pseudouridine synthase B
MINGIINIFKEKNFTSHDVVAKMRGILKQKKIGHTGTLDPDATGVLLVCLGNATKLCDIITDRTKEYEAEMLFGVTTDTQDISGKVIKTSDVIPSDEEIKKAIEKFSKSYMQLPPMYSALKVNGKKLVDLAREGVEVERKKRLVNIYSLDILELKYPKAKLRVKCGKGTYIRTLCHDIGESLGCGASLTSLIRTEVSGFRAENAITLNTLEKLRDEDKIKDILISTDRVFESLKKLYVNDESRKYAYNGNKLNNRNFTKLDTYFSNNEKVCIYDLDKKFLGVYEFLENENAFKPYKLFL